MAHCEKSAGDGAMPGSMAQTGFKPLSEAGSARLGEALSPSVFMMTLGSCTQQAYELGALIDQIHTLISGDENDVGRAELLAGLANRRADEFADFLCGVETDFHKLMQLGVRHG